MTLIFILNIVIFLLLLLLCRNVLFNVKNYLSNANCISLIIPSTFYSWRKCRSQILLMICNSRRLPDEIIIVISNSGYNKREIIYTSCKKNIHLLFKKLRKNSASNKNFGSKYSHCKYISFFDSDDIMSKYRMFILNHITTYYQQYDIIMHMYTRNFTRFKNIVFKDYYNISLHFYLNPLYITKLYKRNIRKYRIKLWGCCHFLPKQYPISNGWITVKKSLFNQEKFNEDKSIQRAEDSEYNGRVISKGYKALILTIILGYYSKQNECNKLLQI